MSSQRLCPCCGKTYGPDYTDTFCTCGIELEFADAGGAAAPTEVAAADPVTLANRPAAGTPCLVLYGTGRQPLHYFPLIQDVTVIGRQDAVAGHFPDIDLGACLDEADARRVSRAHALVLHSRQTDGFALRPLAGNTGTQVEAEMVAAQQDYPLTPGTRLVLGGAVRLKFEVT
jgi:hypothetical protein